MNVISSIELMIVFASVAIEKGHGRNNEQSKGLAYLIPRLERDWYRTVNVECSA